MCVIERYAIQGQEGDNQPNRAEPDRNQNRIRM